VAFCLNQIVTKKLVKIEDWLILFFYHPLVCLL
jgi:hypothetical protein